MRAAFWRVAHMRYHMKAPSRLTDLAAFTWAAFFILVYGAAILAGWRPNNAIEALVGLTLTATPLIVGILLRRVRIEASKGPNALYLKRVEASR
ncbi:hypothetical protein [Sphingomonas lycopersici]|uniref:Uncharacterized protein n=1 Tax=Sphingomonas lycopersici TaxID=2951807 RepID=A0AA41Z7Y4_9SPHN|nr:hypothetical protein [Sphingomonas lycopersici]MCW6534286.1 hypothetical protein [Sphingomonas lycopersici]